MIVLASVYFLITGEVSRGVNFHGSFREADKRTPVLCEKTGVLLFCSRFDILLVGVEADSPTAEPREQSWITR